MASWFQGYNLDIVYRSSAIHSDTPNSSLSAHGSPSWFSSGSYWGPLITVKLRLGLSKFILSTHKYNLQVASGPSFALSSYYINSLVTVIIWYLVHWTYWRRSNAICLVSTSILWQRLIYPRGHSSLPPSYKNKPEATLLRTLSCWLYCPCQEVDETQFSENSRSFYT